MEEKYMVNDILESSKGSIKLYQDAIIETANQELRQTLQNLRNSEECFHYELFKLSESKGYYVPAQNANPQEIEKVKSQVTK